ncbi:MAG: hypothetical protein PHP85_06565 [Gallionella sp.]|nr:hypothetical protein [Gallionella sp.]
MLRDKAISDKRAAKAIPWPLVLLGGMVMSLAGGVIAAALLGYVPMNASGVKVPLFVLWATALVFLFAGFAMLLSRLSSVIAGWFALGSLLCFVLIFNWIAFGPGERSFTSRSGMGAGGMSSSRSSPASETEGRIVFGIFAGGMDALIAYGLIASLRRRGREDK